MKMTLPEEPVLDGARSPRGEEGAQHQFDGARPDAGAPRLARLTARARERRTSARRASPGLPQSGDPSALRARAPSLTHQPPTAYACFTPLQASTSQACPRARRVPCDELEQKIARLWNTSPPPNAAARQVPPSTLNIFPSGSRCVASSAAVHGAAAALVSLHTPPTLASPR